MDKHQASISRPIQAVKDVNRVMDHNHQLHPLEVNAKTGEPFLRLKKHPNIILTPPRDDDAPAFVPLLNNVRVSYWLGNIPSPYTLDHAKKFVETVSSAAQKVLRQLEDAKAEDKAIIVGGCPVRFLREVKADGTNEFIGDMGVMRSRYGEFMGTDGVDWDNKALRDEENNSLVVGDPNIIWSMGNFVAPQYSGQGIMTDAVNTVLHEWCIPRMNVQRMWVSTFIGNVASVRVFEKNGFVLIKASEGHVEIKGKLRGLNILEWRTQS
ncbi:hypothetical protein D9619_002819 [Psilocybe cf. subviscida]|uniref:N-acetyltransferase domain-containing protein n=1 Tax=Psilocybe cf. subviscida TaxID=2480587 RepID=A0A8H5EUR9_9AGAR|nr:hypothetical protein D9619_002819 [Psilocybe cf. subviscida]